MTWRRAAFSPVLLLGIWQILYEMCPAGGRVETELAASELRYTLGCSKDCSMLKSSVKDVIYSCCIVQRSYFDHCIENVI